MFPRAKYSDDKKDWKSLENPVASVKHDGASFFLQIGPSGESRYFSRRPSVKGGFPERTSQLPHLTDTKLPQFAGNVYNVELVHTGHGTFGKEDHPKLSGILNSLPEKSIETQKQEGPVRAILLDVIHPKLPTYADKLKHMNEISRAFNKPDLIRPLYTKIGRGAIEDLIDSTKKAGQEGVIITSLTKPEEENTRIKVKHINTYNLKVSRINQEYDIKGNPKQSAGSVTVIDSTGREVADVGTGFSRKLREEIFNNPKNWIDREIQVKARTPHRRKLIAPVYNGEPDGSMDKIAESIQDKLLDTLVAQYKAKGVNMQKILDNPLFQQLPLDKKVAFIEQTGSPVSSPTKLNKSFIGTGAFGGGIAGAIATAMYAGTKGGFPAGGRLPGMIMGTIGGAALGGLGGALRALLDKSQDNKTQADSSTSGLNTLINRSQMTKIPGSPFGGNRYLEQMEKMVDTQLPFYAYQSLNY